MQNIQKNSQPGSEISCPLQTKSTYNQTTQDLEAGFPYRLIKGPKFRFWTNTPGMKSSKPESIRNTDIETLLERSSFLLPNWQQTQSKFLWHPEELVVTVKAYNPHMIHERKRERERERGSPVVLSTNLQACANSELLTLKTAFLNINNQFFFYRLVQHVVNFEKPNKNTYLF